MSWWRRVPDELSDDQRALVARRVRHWSMLDEGEQAALEVRLLDLMHRKRWEAARGFALTEEIRLTIAAQAALLVLGLDTDAYRTVSAIVVHRGSHRLTGERPGPVRGVMTDTPLTVSGLARYHGPVVIAWNQAQAAARHPERGVNVVYHEFAHHLDLVDGLLDGTPAIDDPLARERWVAVCTSAYEALREGRFDGPLRSYAATNPGEFFAVTTEAFFDRPTELAATDPALYDVFCAFYRQDPAGRVRRASGA